MENQQERIKEIGEESMKFALVGVSGYFVNLVILFLTFDLIGISENISLVLGIFVSMSTNYLFNKIWTFRSEKFWLPEYVKYIMSNSLGGLIQFTIAYAILLIGSEKLDLIIFSIPMIYIASSIGIVFGSVFNFIMSKLFVFNKEEYFF